MRRLLKIFCCLAVVVLQFQCKQKETGKASKATPENTNEINTQESPKAVAILIDKPEVIATPEGMVWIPGGTINQGAVAHDKGAMNHEKPAHKVSVDGFFMDITEVTNAQYQKFVNETKYVTVAERAIDWEEMKKQLPAGTAKPHDSIMQPGSLTFKKTKQPVANLFDFSQWWRWTIGANWKHPNGPESSIEGKDNDPVVHIAYEDALAYCQWAGKRLPTEAEWERAAKGNFKNAIYTWGDDESLLSKKVNSWEGQFPTENTKLDGYEARAPVKSYPANDFGLYDMGGNVWEWTSDWYNTKYYNEVSTANVTLRNPTGAEQPYNERDQYAREKVMKGGSFLCNASYCASYRVSARMATSLDSSLEHLGFRTVTTVNMINSVK